jgi:hypothetical protein
MGFKAVNKFGKPQDIINTLAKLEYSRAEKSM